MDFLQRLEEIASSGVCGIILRERDLSWQEYEALAGKAMRICEKYDIPCILHSFVEVAERLGCDQIHLPMHILRQLSDQEKAGFRVIGASVHSLEEAREAEGLGCSYITAGHIFATDCKRGLAPRGTDFLRQICENISLPVYAIGGIEPERMGQVLRCGAAGGCVMSGLMECGDVAEYMKEYRC